MNRPRFIDVEGRRTRVLVRGPVEAPVLVMLHGVGRSLEDWNPSVPALAQQHRVISLDLPGFGYSQRRPEPATLTSLALGVLETLDALDEARPVHLVGNSLGGGVALQIQAIAPQRVASTVLVDPVGFGSEVSAALRMLTVPGLGRLVTSRPSPLSLRFSERLSFADPALATPARIEHAAAIAQRPDPATVMQEIVRHIGSVRGVKVAWRRALLKTVALHPRPTLVVWGERDRVLPARHMREVRRHLPHAATHEFMRVGHMPQIECPEEFVAVVNDHIAGLGQISHPAATSPQHPNPSKETSVLNLSIVLEDSARAHPDREALVLGDTRLTYAQVNGLANQVANLLRSRGVGRGDRVALSSPNLPWFPVIYYGALKAGAAVVPLNVLLKGREIAYHLTDAKVSAYFCFEGTSELAMGTEGHSGFTQSEADHFFLITADPGAPSPIAGVQTLGQALAGQSPVFEAEATAATDTAAILYTSGTTGQPKGAELSHANILVNTLTCNRLFESRPVADAQVVALPLFHTFGATVQMHAGFSMAATLHLVPRFDAAHVIGIMEREDITFFAGVPTMWWGLLDALTEDVDVDRIAKNLRLGISGGSSLPADIITRTRERLGVQILEGYGLSETSPVVTFSDPELPPRPGSIGRPIWGVSVKLVDSAWNEVTAVDEIGEIAVRGHNVMKGYFGRPEATAEVMNDGWFRTGDLARRDEDGFYFIVDRAKDLIIRGGLNVYPREIEEVLMSHPGISLASVIGVPHNSHGEEIKAFVILNEGSSLTSEDLIAWSREQMAAYKYPRIVDIADSLPMTATGKILKRDLS